MFGPKFPIFEEWNAHYSGCLTSALAVRCPHAPSSGRFGRDEHDAGVIHATHQIEGAALELSEPTLDGIEPRRTGGGEVEVDVGPGLQPIANLLRLIRAVIVEDDVQRCLRRSRLSRTRTAITGYAVHPERQQNAVRRGTQSLQARSSRCCFAFGCVR